MKGRIDTSLYPEKSELLRQPCHLHSNDTTYDHTNLMMSPTSRKSHSRIFSTNNVTSPQMSPTHAHNALLPHTAHLFPLQQHISYTKTKSSPNMWPVNSDMPHKTTSCADTSCPRLLGRPLSSMRSPGHHYDNYSLE